jgi:hypothetical protein
MRPFGVGITTLDNAPTLGFVVAKASEPKGKTATIAKVAAAMVIATVLRRSDPQELLVTRTG